MSKSTEVFSWGSNHSGQLGTGQDTSGRNSSVPKLTCFSVVIKSVGCGFEHSVFLSDNGHVYSMGSNQDGKLGIGDKIIEVSTTPTLVDSLLGRTVKKVSCGARHTAAVTVGGELFTWGTGDYGALGLGDCESRWIPFKVDLESVLDISCGYKHSLVVNCENGKKLLKGFGDNEQCELGKESEPRLFPVPINLSDPLKISAGAFHSLILTEDASLYSTGCNLEGELGTGFKSPCESFNRIKAIETVYVKQISAGSFSACVSERGELFIWGFNEIFSPEKVLEKMKQVSVGDGFAAVLDKKGRVWTWGENKHGELGQSDFVNRDRPVEIENLLNRKLKRIETGGKFCIGLGADFSENLTDRKEPPESERTPRSQTARHRSFLRTKPLKKPKLSINSCISTLKSQSDDPKINEKLSFILEKFQDLFIKYSTKRKEFEELAKQNELKEVEYKQAQAELNRERLKIKQLENNLQNNRNALSVKESAIESLTNENAILRDTLDEVRSQEMKYITLYTRECETRKNIEKKLQEKLPWNQGAMRSLIEEYENRMEMIEKENIQLKQATRPDRYEPSPNDSRLSVSSGMDCHRRVSSYNQLRSSRSVSELGTLLESPITPLQSVSPMEFKDLNSPRFIIEGNTPPTFREGGLADSVSFIEEQIHNSLTHIKELIMANKFPKI